eukprot:2793699-Alexandrium_andersonii.AAC.1
MRERVFSNRCPRRLSWRGELVVEDGAVLNGKAVPAHARDIQVRSLDAPCSKTATPGLLVGKLRAKKRVIAANPCL